MDTLTLHTSYLSNAFAEPGALIEPAQRVLEGVEYDTMIGTGLSGALVVPTLARAFRKHWAIVRKSTEDCHSEQLIEGTIGHRWLFVDDLIDLGGTLERVVDKVRWALEVRPEHAMGFAGAYLYGVSKVSTPRFRDPQFLHDLYGVCWSADDEQLERLNGCECEFCTQASRNTPCPA